MTNPTTKQKFLYFIYLIICLFLWAFLSELGDKISRNFISMLPTTYTVEQDEKREWWATAFNNVFSVGMLIFILVIFWEKVHHYVKRYSKSEQSK